MWKQCLVVFDLPFLSFISTFRVCWRLKKKTNPPTQTSNCLWVTWNPDYGNVNHVSQHTYSHSVCSEILLVACASASKGNFKKLGVVGCVKAIPAWLKWMGLGAKQHWCVFYEVFSKGPGSQNWVSQQTKAAEKGGWRTLRGDWWMFLIWDRGMVAFLSFFCVWKSSFQLFILCQTSGWTFQLVAFWEECNEMNECNVQLLWRMRLWK